MKILRHKQVGFILKAELTHMCGLIIIMHFIYHALLLTQSLSASGNDRERWSCAIFLRGKNAVF